MTGTRSYDGQARQFSNWQLLACNIAGSLACQTACKALLQTDALAGGKNSFLPSNRQASPFTARCLPGAFKCFRFGLSKFQLGRAAEGKALLGMKVVAPPIAGRCSPDRKVAGTPIVGRHYPDRVVGTPILFLPENSAMQCSWREWWKVESRSIKT